MTYANIPTPGGVEARLGGNSGGPGYFNPLAFGPAPVIGDGTGYGDSGSGILLGPGHFNWDMSLLKTTRITERHMLQFRAEFFNIFNHPNFQDASVRPMTITPGFRAWTDDYSNIVRITTGLPAWLQAALP